MKRGFNLPIPTKQHPFIQVEFIFDRVMDLKRSDDTKSNYRSGKNFFIRYLKETSNYDEDFDIEKGFYLNKDIDEFIMVKISSFIEKYNKKEADHYLTSHTITTNFSAIRKVMEYAVMHKLTSCKNIIDVALPSAERETVIHEPYSYFEEIQIMDALREELKYVDFVLSGEGYKPTGVGMDPRIRKGIHYKSGGWSNIDNVRWYFENEMNCVPLLGTPENKVNHNSFFHQCGFKHQHLGGLQGVYRNWGVASLVTSNLLMPLAVLLTSLTGLNPQSVFDLTVDCFQEKHPLTNRPCILYRKERSGGDKTLHINLFDKDVETKHFEMHDGKLIKSLFKKIVKLTENIRSEAPEELKNKMMLLQSDSRRSLGEIGGLNSHISSTWCTNFVKKYKITDDEGNPTVLNLVRFRPTKIANLVEEGFDIFQIQHVAGHKSVATTLTYLSKNRLEIEAKQKVHEAIISIQRNCQWVENQKPTYSSVDQPQEKTNVIYRGFMCDCKNPFDPPQFARQTKKTKKGVCTQFNMCLLCPNVIIMKHHLPLLYQYLLQIENIMHCENGSFIHLEEIYKPTHDVLKSIFDETDSEFNEEELREAIKIGSNLDVIVDPLLYSPVERRE